MRHRGVRSTLVRHDASSSTCAHISPRRLHRGRHDTHVYVEPVNRPQWCDLHPGDCLWECGLHEPGFSTGGISTTQFTLSPGDALASGDHIWHVRAVDGAGNIGDLSAAFTFTVVEQVTPQQHTVKGTMKLQSMPNPITGALITFSTNPTVFQVTSNPQDGSFEIGLPPGTYDITVAKDGFLTATKSGVVVNQDIRLPELKLLNGDVNGDSVIDVNDLVIPARNQGKKKSPCHKCCGFSSGRP